MNLWSRHKLHPNRNVAALRNLNAENVKSVINCQISCVYAEIFRLDINENKFYWEKPGEALQFRTIYCEINKSYVRFLIIRCVVEWTLREDFERWFWRVSLGSRFFCASDDELL